MWAIGSDRQVYLHCYGLDVPIRVKEEAYENERWYPIEGNFVQFINQIGFINSNYFQALVLDYYQLIVFIFQMWMEQ